MCIGTNKALHKAILETEFEALNAHLQRRVLVNTVVIVCTASFNEKNNKERPRGSMIFAILPGLAPANYSDFRPTKFYATANDFCIRPHHCRILTTKKEKTTAP
jgi:hypothetical protein